MAKTKFYAVQIGKVPGVYESWDECKAQIDGVPGAKYKSYKTREEAEQFVNGELDYDHKTGEVEITENIYSFVDGSFNPETNVYGCGGFLIVDNTKYPIQASASDELTSMRNVAGELLGARLAVEKALELNLPEITILYDYLGIECWATGEWKANLPGTIAYKNFINDQKDKINIKFRKVKAHTGIPGNEEADKLAKEAVGIS